MCITYNANINCCLLNLCISSWNLQSYMSLFTFKCRQCLRLRHEYLHCLFHLQQSPHCFNSQHKKTTTLHPKHTTPNTTLHTKCHKSLNSQNLLPLSPSLLLSVFCQHPSHNFPCSSQPNHVICHIIVWLVCVVAFSTNRNMFSCL